MSAELILATAAVIGVCITGGSLVVSLRRNGRDSKARDEERDAKQAEKDEKHAVQLAIRDRDLETGYQAVVKRLDDPKHGLSALSDSITNLRNDYTDTTGRHDARLNALES